MKANVLFFERKEGAEHPWTRDLWVYDLRTNKHFTLKQNPITRADLDDFVDCYKPGARHQRVESERFKKYTYDELIAAIWADAAVAETPGAFAFFSRFMVHSKFRGKSFGFTEALYAAAAVESRRMGARFLLLNCTPALAPLLTSPAQP